MEFLWPVGVFFAGLGVLLWGVGELKHSDVAKAAIDLEERQFQHERSQAKEEA